MNIGDKVFVSGRVKHKGKTYEIDSYGYLEFYGIDASLIKIERVGSDENCSIIVKNKYLSAAV